MLDSIEFGMKIQNLRKLNKMTQDELSNKLFISRQALSKWELGEALPSIDKLLDLSKIFNVSIDELLKSNTEIDGSDIFKGHSRDFIINEIINNNLKVDLVKEFDNFTISERMIILKNIKLKKIECDIKNLKEKLTKYELKYMEIK